MAIVEHNIQCVMKVRFEVKYASSTSSSVSENVYFTECPLEFTTVIFEGMNASVDNEDLFSLSIHLQ